MLDNPIPLLGITILVVLAGLFAIRPLRRAVITRPIFSAYRKVLPQMSDTERDALEAGSVWWEGELFRGKPDWKKLHAYPVPTLTPAEQSFLDNECEEACRLVDDWKVTHELYDLPHEAWRYIKDKGFLGMIIPKKYGGLEFSAYAHSQVVTKLSTRSSALSVSVMVPNSLGPAELLLHYGTEEQKNHYLPRLAKGIEVPAFALTSPWAGSDAASIPDTGVICKGLYQGKEVLGMRVSWDKRYITLAPVCTVFGLAFHLFDPDGLLGDKKHIGITCALVPYDHPGVDTGRRHFPLNAMFMNGPTRGKEVFMPLEFIIGGPKMAGQGWRMLMECLAAGRSISLPSSNTGMAHEVARAKVDEAMAGGHKLEAIKLLRDADMPCRVMATRGQFQQTLPQSRSFQLLRLRIDPSLDVVPEISGNRLMVSVRLMRQDEQGHLQPSVDDAPFELTLCA